MKILSFFLLPNMLFEVDDTTGYGRSASSIPICSLAPAQFFYLQPPWGGNKRHLPGFFGPGRLLTVPFLQLSSAPPPPKGTFFPFPTRPFFKNGLKTVCSVPPVFSSDIPAGRRHWTLIEGFLSFFPICFFLVS